MDAKTKIVWEATIYTLFMNKKEHNINKVHATGIAILISESGFNPSDILQEMEKANIVKLHCITNIPKEALKKLEIDPQHQRLIEYISLTPHGVHLGMHAEKVINEKKRIQQSGENN